MNMSSFLLYTSIFAITQGVNAATLCSDGIHSVANSACCALFPVMTDIQAIFDVPTCSDIGRSFIHLAFHDAMGFSASGGGGGGADGSILTFNTVEMTFPSNSGVVFQETIDFLKPISTKHNITDGDLLHFAAAVSLSSCPGAPRIPFMFGRPKSNQTASPSKGVPSSSDNVTTILARFADVGFSSTELVSLMAAHSIAATHGTVDAGAIGVSLDTTPQLFDTQIYIEALLPGLLYPGNGSNMGEVMSPLAAEVRLESDFQLARDSRTACAWQSLAVNQALMANNFQAAMQKLSLLGQNKALMVDCSDVIPLPQALPSTSTPHFPPEFNMDEIQASCAMSTPFSSIRTTPGPTPTAAPECYAVSRCWSYGGISTAPTTPTPTAIVNVEKALVQIFFRLTDFDNSIIAFPDVGGSFTTALIIHTAAMNFLNSVNVAIVDAQAVILPISAIDAQTIFTQIQGVVPGLEKTLQRLVAKKPALQLVGNGFTSTVAQDLKSLNSAVSLVETEVLRLAPTSILSQALILKAGLDSVFANATAAYPN